MTTILLDPGETDSGNMRSLLVMVPENPVAAFVLADYLEEQDDARWRLQEELLRLMYTLTRPVGGKDRTHQEERMPTLLGQVTQLQYTRVFGHNPSWGSTQSTDVEAENRNKPVQEVTWYEAVAFLKRLSTRSSAEAARPCNRLPTEAEWEYACRTGTTTRFWCGNDEAAPARVAWYRHTEGDLQPVGEGGQPSGTVRYARHCLGMVCRPI